MPFLFSRGFELRLFHLKANTACTRASGKTVYYRYACSVQIEIQDSYYTVTRLLHESADLWIRFIRDIRLSRTYTPLVQKTFFFDI